MLKQLIITSLLCSQLSSTLNAYPNNSTLPWLVPMLSDEVPAWHIELLNQTQALFDCGEEEHKKYCSEPVNYYKTPVDSFLLLEQGSVNKIEIVSTFSAINYSELQLNLRKDGYVLAWLEIGDKHIDIIEELKTKPFHVIDREVVMFMNKGKITTPRKLIWYPTIQFNNTVEPSRYVEFISDGIKITLRFVKSKKQLS